MASSCVIDVTDNLRHVIRGSARSRAGDAKELGAALAALMFNLYQLLRTLMEMALLYAFVRWCTHAVECIRALLGGDEEGNDDANDVADVQDKLKVSNSVVDNELGASTPRRSHRFGKCGSHGRGKNFGEAHG